MGKTMVPPGRKLQLEMARNAISNETMAQALDLTEAELQELLAGDMELTPFLAAKLEYSLEIPAMTWLNLETIYRKQKANN